MIYVYGYPIVGGLTLIVGCVVMHITTRRIFDRAEEARLTVPMPPRREELTDLIVSHRSEETAPPWPAGYAPRHALVTIGDRARAYQVGDTAEYFLAEFHRIVGAEFEATVEIGRAAA